MNDSLFDKNAANSVNDSSLVAQQKAGDNAQELSVSEISSSLKKMVEDRFGYVKIRGEISGFKRAASGHCYFGLKDDKALIDGVMWKGNAARLPFAAEDGLEVVASGKVTTYPGRSKYQIVVDSMALAGEGALMALFEKIKARLDAEGLFDPARRRPLPYLPRTIGIVTSPTGSVIRDMLHRLSDRFPSHVIVWPTIVQGDGSASKIAAAINGFNMIKTGSHVKRPDLLIVARGGGSIEDLWAFNEEEVVRAVAASDIPIISAVGHETDTTLCDYAADLRAPTPTAAAEMAVPVRDDLLYTIAEYGQRADTIIRRMIALGRERVETQSRLMPKLSEITAPHQQRADEYGERLKQALKNHIGKSDVRLAGPSSSLKPQILNRLMNDKLRQLHTLRLTPALMNRGLNNAQERLDAIWRLAESLHPDRPLKQGFARITNHHDKTLTSAKAARAEDAIYLHFSDDTVEAIITQTSEGTHRTSSNKALKNTTATDNVEISQKAARKTPKPKKKIADIGQADLFT